MKKNAILILAVLMLLAVAAPATAKPPNCDDNPSHPSCGDPGEEEVPAGTECMESIKLGDDMLADATDTDFDFSVDAQTPNACIDVSKVAASGTWTINFEVVSGSLRELIVSVRDSVAGGDLCAEARLRRPSDQSGNIALHPDAADFVNACGTQYGEIVDGTTYNTVEPGIQSPLAFLVWARGKDLVIEFSVNFPNTP